MSASAPSPAVLGAFPRDREAARAVAADLDPSVAVLTLDLTDRAEADAVVAKAAEQLGGLDGALHAVAFAPRTALHGPFTEADPTDVELAFRTSAWTLAELARVLAVHAPPWAAAPPRTPGSCSPRRASPSSRPTAIRRRTRRRWSCRWGPPSCATRW